MTPDELKSMPKGSFIVAKTGVHPMQVRLRLFLDWGIRFEKPYEVPEKAQRPVAYATKQALELAIISSQKVTEENSDELLEHTPHGSNVEPLEGNQWVTQAGNSSFRP